MEKKIVYPKAREFGKMWNVINEMCQNPKRIMIVPSEKVKKQKEKLYPYLVGQFKTWEELNKKTTNNFPKFEDEVR